MQVYERRSLTAVQRDMDLARQILLRIEHDPALDGARLVRFEPSDFRADLSAEEVGYHLRMLIEAGLVEGEAGFAIIPMISRLTWKGHEFLDDTRDPDVWSKTKERVKGLTTVGMQLTWELAKAELKKKLGLS